MDAEGTLEVIAEIAIAFTGFAGIVGALARERLKPSQPGVWLGFWVMIESSLGVLLAALFPMLPHYLGQTKFPAPYAFTTKAVGRSLDQYDTTLIMHTWALDDRHERPVVQDFVIRSTPPTVGNASEHCVVALANSDILA